MVIKTRLPRLLDGNLREVCRLHPTALSLQLQMNATSTATMTLDLADVAPAMHAWVEIYTGKGSAGFYRVTTVAHQANLERTYTLLHAIDTLSDCVWAAQTDYSGTAEGYLRQLLACQKVVYWQLGTCQDSGQWKKSGVNYDKVSDLLTEFVGDRHGYYLAYDFTTWPWTLHWLRVPDTVSAEWRLHRNVHSCHVTRNDADLCTRLYFCVTSTSDVGQDGSGGNTTTAVQTINNAAAQALYGVVEKTATVDTADVADPSAWAAQFMADHAEPSVQITVDGYELARLTGDPWDSFDLGKLTRCALVDDGITVSERVVGITYSDVLREPEHVVVELANRLPKFSDSIATASKTAASASATAKSASRSGGGTSQKLDHWAMVVSKQQEALDGTGLTQLYETGIVLDAETGAKIYTLGQGFTSEYSELLVQRGDISTLVTKTGINDLGQAETLYTKITQNESSITSEVARAQGAETVIGSRITQTENDITSIVSKTGVDNLGADETLYSKITQTAGEISTEVTNRTDADSALSSRITQNANSISLVVSNGSISAASIVAAINSAGSSVTISADHVNLEGYVTVSTLTGQGASVYGLLAADDGHYYGALTVDGTADVGNLMVNGLGFFYHKHELSSSINNSTGVVTITEGEITSENVSTSFNMAATTWYAGRVAAFKQAVASALGSAGWTDSSGASTVIQASLDTANKVVAIHSATARISYPGDSGPTTVSIGLGSLDVSTALNSYAAAQKNAVTLSSAGWVNGTNVVSTSAPTPQTYTVHLPAFQTSGGTTFSSHKTTVYFSTQSVNTPLKSVEVDATDEYNAGYSAGQAAATANVVKGSWSGGEISFTVSQGTGTGSGVRVGLTGSWGTGDDVNKYSYTINDYYTNQQGASTGYTGTIDASARYTAGVTAGKNAVTITKGSWSNGSISFTKSEGTASTKSVSLSLTATQLVSTDPNKWTVTAKDGNAITGASVTVDATSRYNAGVTYGKQHCGHTLGGKSISSNGTYYASTDGYSGFSYVVVNCPTGYTNVTTKVDTIEVTESSAGRYKVYVYASSNSGGSEISHATKTTYFTP